MGSCFWKSHEFLVKLFQCELLLKKKGEGGSPPLQCYPASGAYLVRGGRKLVSLQGQSGRFLCPCGIWWAVPPPNRTHSSEWSCVETATQIRSTGSVFMHLSLCTCQTAFMMRIHSLIQVACTQLHSSTNRKTNRSSHCTGLYSHVYEPLMTIDYSGHWSQFCVFALFNDLEFA